MKVSGLLKRFFNNGSDASEKKSATAPDFPAENTRRESAALLHEACVKYAVDFIIEELNKKDSPFKDVPRYRFFREMMILNYWLLDKKAQKNKKAYFFDEICDKYSELFGASSDRQKEIDSILERHKAYYDSWNDITGHQDVFGLKAAEFIFDSEKNIPRMEEVSFWIISYAHSAMKAFGAMLKNLPAN